MTANESNSISADRPHVAKARNQWLKWRRWIHQFGLTVKWWLRPHTSYQPVFVLATHRSGSNLLLDYMNRLPDVRCHSEILCTTLFYGLSRKQSQADFAMRHLRRSLHTLKTPIRGCKLMLDQLTLCRLSPAMLDAEFPGAKYVILYRQSLAEQFLSHQSAKATNQWYLLDGQKPKQPKISIDPDSLRSYCATIRQAYREILDYAWLPQRSALLSYEELAGDPVGCLSAKICPLLEIPPAAPQTALRKQNTLPLEQRVANYREAAPLLLSPLCRQHYSWSQAQALRRAA